MRDKENQDEGERENQEKNGGARKEKVCGKRMTGLTEEQRHS